LLPPRLTPRISHLFISTRIWAGADKFVLAGGSYGGFIGLEYALLHSDKLIALILRDTFASGPAGVRLVLHTVLTSTRIHPDHERQKRLWAGKAIDNEDFMAGFLEILPLYTPPSDTPALPQSAANFEGAEAIKKQTFHYATHNAAFSENLPNYDVRSKLGKIPVPTLVVVGRQDLIAPIEFSEEISRGIPGAELAIFEKSGHSPPSDEPEAFQACIRKFIGSLI
jgi:proline iminopeptidase